MRTKLVVLALLAALFAAPPMAFARGGGGFEYFTNAGSDLLGGLGLPDAFMTDYVSGTIMGSSFYGYGITRGGWKIGGFGTVFYTAPISMAMDTFTVDRAIGGIGGIMSGGHARLGPFTFALNTRLGMGGMGVEMYWGDVVFPYWDGTFFFYGSADVEVGLVYVPAMMVSVYAGVQAIVTVPYVVAAVAAPTMGVRITWGRF